MQPWAFISAQESTGQLGRSAVPGHTWVVSAGPAAVGGWGGQTQAGLGLSHGIQHSGREREQGTRLLEAQAVPSATVSWPEQITRPAQIQEEQTASISCQEALQSGGRRPGWWQGKNWGQFCSLPASGPAAGLPCFPRVPAPASWKPQLPAPSSPRLPSELFLVGTEAVVQNDFEGGFQWPLPGGEGCSQSGRVKPSTDPMKLRQAAFSISQHGRAASPGAETTARRSLLCLHLRPARLLGAVPGWGVVLHCHP